MKKMMLVLVLAALSAACGSNPNAPSEVPVLPTAQAPPPASNPVAATPTPAPGNAPAPPSASVTLRSATFSGLKGGQDTGFDIDVPKAGTLTIETRWTDPANEIWTQVLGQVSGCQMLPEDIKATGGCGLIDAAMGTGGVHKITIQVTKPRMVEVYVSFHGKRDKSESGTVVATLAP